MVAYARKVAAHIILFAVQKMEAPPAEATVLGHVLYVQVEFRIFNTREAMRQAKATKRQPASVQGSRSESRANQQRLCSTTPAARRQYQTVLASGWLTSSN